MDLRAIIDVNGPNRAWGRHQVEVVLQAWDYRKAIVTEVGGADRGLDVLERAVDNVLDQVEDAGILVLTAPDGETLRYAEGEDSWTDAELRGLVVSVRIVGYEPPTVNALRVRNGAEPLPDGDRPSDLDAEVVARRRAADAA